MDFNLLVKEYQQKVYWQVRRMVYNHEDANDLVQDIFVKIFKNYHTFKGESQLSSWIFRIAYNETINFINKRSKLNAVSIDEYIEMTANSLESDVYFDGNEIQLLLQMVHQRF